MVLKKKFKNKEICYLEDPIMMSIDYDLHEGDIIFKKLCLKQSVLWLKKELIKLNSIDINLVSMKIDEAFIDVVKGSSKKIVDSKKYSQEDVKKFFFNMIK